MSFRSHLHARAHRRELDGHARIGKQRRTALILVVTGLGRVLAWVSMMLLYVLHLMFPNVAGFTAALFQSVPFVAMISLYANAATDFGQVCASLAQLTAGDSHSDIEHVRRQAALDTTAIERDLERLAQLQPGPESDRLAAEIRAQIAGA